MTHATAPFNISSLVQKQLLILTGTSVRSTETYHLLYLSSKPLTYKLNAISPCDPIVLYGLYNRGPRSKDAVVRCLLDRYNSLLSTFTEKPDDFRAAMKNTGTVLSGSRCLAFLSNATWANNDDFDFYCSYQGFDAFVHYLISVLHAEREVHFADSQPPPDPDDGEVTPPPNDFLAPGITERLILSTPHAIFDLKRSRSISSLTPIAHFHTTLLMNFLSADTLCVPYPCGIDDNAFVHTSELTAAHPFLTRYTNRGYNAFESSIDYFTDLYEPCCVPHGYCPKQPRYFGDMHCLTFRLHTPQYVPVEEQAWSAGWTFGGRKCGGDKCRFDADRRVHPAILPTPHGLT